jgi:hypothetical protein
MKSCPSNSKLWVIRNGTNNLFRGVNNIGGYFALSTDVISREERRAKLRLP